LPRDKAAICLDIPCGYGNFLYFLKQNFYTRCYGYDLDQRQVELALSIDLPAQRGDALVELMKRDEGGTALISSLDFLEHLDKNAAISFLEACYRSLGHRGVLILRMPCCDGFFGAHDLHNDITHQWGVTSNALRGLLAMVGFESIQLLDEPPSRDGPSAFVRLLISKFARTATAFALRLMYLAPPTIWGRSMWAIAIK
jgi:SAM-dependent methyltransferase